MHSRSGNGSVVVSDQFRLLKPAVISEALPTYGTWKKIDEHTLLISLDNRQLRVTVDAPKPIALTETRVTSEGRVFTRISAQVALETSGTITMSFTPETP